jgi:DNA-binding response OmpR family regulator
VESDGVLGAVLEEVLCHSGFEVIIVSTLKGEVKLIHSAGAVILDVDMTAADRELARLSLLQLCRESLPIVLMGVEGPGELNQLQSPHALRLQNKHLAWVKKPFRNDELLAAVRQVQESPVSVPGNRNVNPWALRGARDT